MCVFVKMTCDASDASDAFLHKNFNNYADLPIEVREDPPIKMVQRNETVGELVRDIYAPRFTISK